MRFGRVVAGALAGVLVMAACSSSGNEPVVERAEADPSSSSTTSTSTPSTSTTTSTPTTTTDATDVHRLAPTEAADDAAGLAAQIEAAEAAIRDPGTAEADVARAGRLQQVAYRKLGVTPDWDDAVLAALPAHLRESARRHVWARREFRAMHTKLSDTLPAWEIVPPVPLDELIAHYQEAEAAHGIPWRYLAAINLVETGLGRIRGTSVAGAQGPMQFMPATWEAYGEGDVDDPRDAIMAAARYLAANGGATDIDAALFRYNNSQRYVRGVKLYADLIAEHDRAFAGLYHWGVWYLTARGDVYLPVGYRQAEPVPVEAYLAER